MSLSPRVITVPTGFSGAFQFGAFNDEAQGPPTFAADFGNVTTSLVKQKGLPQNTLYKRIVIYGDQDGLGHTGNGGVGFPKAGQLSSLPTTLNTYWPMMNWGDDASLVWSTAGSSWTFTLFGFGGGGGDWASWWCWSSSNVVGSGSFDPAHAGAIAIAQKYYFERPTTLKLWRISFGNTDSAQTLPSPTTALTIMTETGTVTYGTDQSLISTTTATGDTTITLPVSETPDTAINPADTTDDQIYNVGMGQFGVGYYVDLGQS